jgi:DNA mismatch endonuclease, patch repair protein
MQATPRRDTPAELALRRSLHHLGLRFRVQVKIESIPRRTIDIAFPRSSVAVFVDGCYWHGCPVHGSLPKSNRPWWRDKIAQNKRRDKHTSAVLAHDGWKVIRVWEHEAATPAARRIALAVRRFRAARKESLKKQRGQIP